MLAGRPVSNAGFIDDTCGERESQDGDEKWDDFVHMQASLSLLSWADYNGFWDGLGYRKTRSNVSGFLFAYPVGSFNYFRGGI